MRAPALEATKRVLASTDRHRARRYGRLLEELADETKALGPEACAILAADAGLARAYHRELEEARR